MPLTWILLVLLGAVMGWLVSVVIHGRTAGEIVTLLLTGTAGALVGALLITPSVAGRLEPTGFSLPGLLFSLLGSVLGLAAAAAILVSRRRSRTG
jgi:uncharacterized membrane protein YeaQ/YmgE (transglycosylase-associated protein family)